MRTPPRRTAFFVAAGLLAVFGLPALGAAPRVFAVHLALAGLLVLGGLSVRAGRAGAVAALSAAVVTVLTGGWLWLQARYYLPGSVVAGWALADAGWALAAERTARARRASVRAALMATRHRPGLVADRAVSTAVGPTAGRSAGAAVGAVVGPELLGPARRQLADLEPALLRSWLATLSAAERGEPTRPLSPGQAAVLAAGVASPATRDRLLRAVIDGAGPPAPVTGAVRLLGTGRRPAPARVQRAADLLTEVAAAVSGTALHAAVTDTRYQVQALRTPDRSRALRSGRRRRWTRLPRRVPVRVTVGGQ